MIKERMVCMIVKMREYEDECVDLIACVVMCVVV